MLKNLSLSGCSMPARSSTSSPATAPVESLQDLLGGWLDRLCSGTAPVQIAPAGAITSRGAGHFHLAPELFLQIAGTTRFRFPDAAITLAPGEALLVPPQLLHDERVRAGGPGRPFRNLVLYAEGAALSCHLAHEVRAGRPGILHLEARRDAQVARVHDWLSDASRLGADLTADAAEPTRRWAATQARALVSAAVAGALRALHDRHADVPAEPALVARLRLLVQNQLGDHALSVRGLAQQSGCTPDYLSHLFSRTTGEHLVAYIKRARMQRAARLLSEGTMAGKEIAWACGYSTQSYFVRSFREHFGATPSAWRVSARATAAR